MYGSILVGEYELSNLQLIVEIHTGHMVDLSRARLQPYNHQRIGVEKIVENPFFFLADEMGAGKTKQTIDAAQVLAEQGIINHVLVIAPATVRAVWFDPELGELAKHLWAYFPCTITEYHAKLRTWPWFIEFEGKKHPTKLHWTITNYDFIRSKERLREIVKICDKKTLLVLDESSAVKSWNTLQTKACKEIRQYCGRVLELNGTPIANNPGDLYSQADILDSSILACKTYFHFRARYGIMGGWQNRQVVKWVNLEDLQQRMAPYVLRRLKEQCLDLPPKIDSVPITIPLSPQSWKIYKEMREEMVTWLSTSSLSMASQAVVKAIRLAQITSGFIGGVEVQEAVDEELPDFIEEEAAAQIPRPPSIFEIPLQEVGREKLDAFLIWLEEMLENDPNLKLLVWCRFRPEVERLYQTLADRAKIHLGRIWGGQKQHDRETALRLLDPRTTPEGPVVVIGTPSSGSMGLNLTAAHTVIYLSNDFSLKTRLQSEDRVHRPGQTHPVSYFDMIATGPQGQKTIDHMVVAALKNKETIADMTTSAWITALTED